MSDAHHHQQPPTPPTPYRSAPQSQSRRPDEPQDLTWLDFLRSTAGGTAPPSRPLNRETSADRKRRHAGPSPERRTHPNPPMYTPSSMSGNTAGRRPSGAGVPIPAPGGSRETAVDLTSPPRPRPSMSSCTTRHGSVGSGGSPGQGSDIVLPAWQPDGDVLDCPVCKMEFTFWYRKHHCRKCGRVVCAACSPHRITIPKQYIVQPPSPLDTEYVSGEPDSPRPMGRTSLGGGEVVRVCNPCVPDPWTPETAAMLAGQRPPDIPARPLIEAVRNASDRSDPRQRPERYRFIQPPPPLIGVGRDRATSISHPSAFTLSRSMPQGRANVPPLYLDGRPTQPQPSQPRPVVQPTQPRPVPHRYSQSTGTSSIPPIPPFYQRSSMSSTPSTPPRPKARKEVKEEDECPVCGMELPPGEQVREAHIQECISTRFSGTPTNSNSMPIPPPRTSSVAGAGGAGTGATTGVASSSTPPTVAAGSALLNRARPTSYRPRGMAVYKATEKDCIDDDGEAQECVICLEDFQPGDEMGRMECLCKFHRLCIRRWWDTKGVGSCPTHQLHE